MSWILRRAASALRFAAELLSSAESEKKRSAKRKADRVEAELRLVKLMGITCIHEFPRGGGYCDRVKREGFVEQMCPLGKEPMRAYCTRTKSWSK